MNKKRKTMLSSTTVLMLIVATISIGILHSQAFGQQNTTDVITGLEGILNGINKTRQALQANDTTAALQSINGMDSQLFEIRRNLP